MAYAICLRLDADAEVVVEAVWRKLAGAGISDDMVRLGYAPHLSLAVLDEEPHEAVVAGALEDGVAIDCQLGPVRQFDGTDVVWLALAGGEVLMDLHRRVLQRLPTELVRSHYRIGSWTPHVTLQTKGDATRATALAEAAWPEQQSAKLVGMELVRFPPVVVLKHRAFRV
ncbi:2'-5' RNA ligase family protein [Devosia sp. A8/3-2]|nr:2'-5' RNA ligase family protein [Devosia sp. A8/3-2]